MSQPFTFNHYERMLTTALDSGYVFDDYAARQHLLRQAENGCILRHDCDYDLVAAGKLAHIETDFGIRSTWFLMLRSEMYNLMSRPNSDIVDGILRRGHRIGLHFDPSFYGTLSNETLCDRIDEERELLRRLFGQQIAVVSFHQPTTPILENHVKIRCCNTYDRNDMAGFHYISDSNMNWREACPTVIFRERRWQHLQLLIHPEWWTEEAQTIEQKYETMFRHTFEQAQEVLLQKDRTYNTGRRLSLSVA